MSLEDPEDGGRQDEDLVVPLQVIVEAHGALLALRVDMENQVFTQRGAGRGWFAKIQKRLGFDPRIQFADGVDDLVRWVREQQAGDTFDRAHVELKTRGLVT